MNWSIDAEWYDPKTHLPPNDENILIYFLKEDWAGKLNPTISIGFRFNRRWFIDGPIISQNHVLAWTWLPKMPKVWVNKDE